MALVEEVAEEAGIENPKICSTKPSTTTTTKMQHSPSTNFKAPLKVVAQHVLREVEETQPEETAIPDLWGKIDIDVVEEGGHLKDETQRHPRVAQAALENHRAQHREWRRRRRHTARSRQPCHRSDDARLWNHPMHRDGLTNSAAAVGPDPRPQRAKGAVEADPTYEKAAENSDGQGAH